MTVENAKDIVRQYYKVLKSANGESVTVLAIVEEAKQLIGNDEVNRIEQEVNS